MRSLKRRDPESFIRRYMLHMEFIPVDVRVIGDDPGSRATRAVVVYRLPDTVYASGSYFVCDCWDYTGCEDRRICPDLKSEITGVSISYLSETPVGRIEAIRMASQRVTELLTDYTWFVPGTEELVPGCWGFME